MKYTVYLSEKAQEDIRNLRKGGEIKALKKISNLVEELEEHLRTL